MNGATPQGLCSLNATGPLRNGSNSARQPAWGRDARKGGHDAQTSRRIWACATAWSADPGGTCPPLSSGSRDGDLQCAAPHPHRDAAAVVGLWWGEPGREVEDVLVVGERQPADEPDTDPAYVHATAAAVVAAAAVERHDYA